jgi:hypothetical protein
VSGGSPGARRRFNGYSCVITPVELATVLELEPLKDLDLPEDVTRHHVQPVFPQPPSQAPLTLPRLIVGVACGILLAWLVMALWTTVALNFAAGQLALKLEKQSAQVRAETQRIENERALRQARVEAQVREQMMVEARAIQLQSEWRRQRIDEDERKRQAWARYFQPDVHCNEVFDVECANASIRARRAFETDYAAGRVH